MERKNNKKTVFILLLMIAVVSVLLFLTEAEKRRSPVTEEAETEKEEASIELSLPETFYVLSGQTLEIYNDQVTGLGKEIRKYNVCWNCEIGENLERKYTLKAEKEMAGEHTLTFSVYDNELQLLKEKKCKLLVIDAESLTEQPADLTSSEYEQFAAEQLKCCVDMEHVQETGEQQRNDIYAAVAAGMILENKDL